MISKLVIVFFLCACLVFGCVERQTQQTDGIYPIDKIPASSNLSSYDLKMYNASGGFACTNLITQPVDNESLFITCLTWTKMEKRCKSYYTTANQLVQRCEEVTVFD